MKPACIQCHCPITWDWICRKTGHSYWQKNIGGTWYLRLVSCNALRRRLCNKTSQKRKPIKMLPKCLPYLKTLLWVHVYDTSFYLFQRHPVTSSVVKISIKNFFLLPESASRHYFNFSNFQIKYNTNSILKSLHK